VQKRELEPKTKTATQLKRPREKSTRRKATQMKRPREKSTSRKMPLTLDHKQRYTKNSLDLEKSQLKKWAAYTRSKN
jgi:hypothetical protein